MAKGVYLIDPDGKSGMLDDGTEFVAVLDHHDKEKKGICDGCIGCGKPDICSALPQCYSWSNEFLQSHRVPPNKTWFYKVKD